MSVDNFFMHYEALTISEEWSSIIEFGRTALDDSLDHKNNALINIEISNALFYLGNKNEALNAAIYAKGNATITENKELEAMSLYLLSAVHRSLGAEEEAFLCIQASLNYIDNPELTQMTKLKIFFNAAALYHDLGHNYIKAKNYYAQALEICKEINDKDYCNRTSIRSIRITLELGDKILAAQRNDPRKVDQ